MNHEQFFLENLRLIDAIIAQVCRRFRATVDESKEFQSEMHLRLIEDHYAVLRRYKGESSFRGYLTPVIRNAFLDFRISHWGKHRPSKAARRHDAVGVRLEQLTMRDGYTFNEAVESLWTNYRVTHSREELWAMYVEFPTRVNRRAECADEIDIPDCGPSPLGALEAARQAERRAHAYAVLARMLQELSSRERLILKLWFYHGLKQVDIARRLGEKEKGFHLRCQQLLARVRRRLEAEGIDLKDLGL